MLSAAFIGAGLLNLGVFLWGLSRYRSTRSVALALVLFNLSLLWLDGVTTGLGRYVGDGALLHGLNVARYSWHYLFLPLEIIAAGSILGVSGPRWARSTITMGTFCVIATACVIADAPKALNFDYYRACVGDVFQLVQHVAPYQACTPGEAGLGSAGFPIGAITTVVVLLVAGVILWLRQRWPWLAVGSLVILVVAALPPGPTLGTLPTSFAEAVSSATLLAACLRFGRAHTGMRVRINVK